VGSGLSYDPAMTQRPGFVFAAALIGLASASLAAQQVTKKDVAGISTFAQIESTIACGGATTPEAIREVKKMGFKTVVNLRLASEQGALVDEEGAVVRSLGMNYVHLPFNIQTPDTKLVENFIAAVSAPGSAPAYVHCAAGGRAAALWMIKRVKADGWTQDAALKEADALGLNDRLRPFALNYLKTHP
jgi:uncharacterized protein (TIGR01244 family)